MAVDEEKSSSRYIGHSVRIRENTHRDGNVLVQLIPAAPIKGLGQESLQDDLANVTVENCAGHQIAVRHAKAA